MEKFLLTFDEFRYLQKHKLNWEKRFNIKIILPEAFNSNSYAFIHGAKQQIGALKKIRSLLRKKIKSKKKLTQRQRLAPAMDFVSLPEVGTQNKFNNGKCNYNETTVVMVDSIPPLDKDNDVLEVPRPNCSYLPPAMDCIPLPQVGSQNRFNNEKSQINETTAIGATTVVMADSIPPLDKDGDVIEIPRPNCSWLPPAMDFIPLTQVGTQNRFNNGKCKFNATTVVMADSVPPSDNDDDVVEIPISKCSWLPPAMDFIPLTQVGTQNRFNNRKHKFNATTAMGATTVVMADSIPPPLDNDDKVIEIPRPKCSRRLRWVVIDGSNVAREHGFVDGTFSCKGIQLSVDYFLERGHTQVTVFIPKHRRHQTSSHIPTTNAEILDGLARAGRLVYTPSRWVAGKRQMCYDDRFIVKLAADTGGVILSNDHYKDIMNESTEFKKTIENRLLMYCFVGDMIMIPSDPAGRDGPSLDDFLSLP